MRAPEITISAAQIFAVEVSLLRVSARHPCAFCETELARGFAHVSITAPWCFPLERAAGESTSSVDERPQPAYSHKRSMYNPYFLESHITKTENYGLNSIGENHENVLTDTAAAILAGIQCCVHRSRNSCSRSFVPIPELTMIMIAQYNVRNYPPYPLPIPELTIIMNAQYNVRNSPPFPNLFIMNFN